MILIKTYLLSSFGLLRANIALNLHINELKLILSRHNFKYEIIDISEHEIREDTQTH